MYKIELRPTEAQGGPKATGGSQEAELGFEPRPDTAAYAFCHGVVASPWCHAHPKVEQALRQAGERALGTQGAGGTLVRCILCAPVLPSRHLSNGFVLNATYEPQRKT